MENSLKLEKFPRLAEDEEEEEVPGSPLSAHGEICEHDPEKGKRGFITNLYGKSSQGEGLLRVA